MIDWSKCNISFKEAFLHGERQRPFGELRQASIRRLEQLGSDAKALGGHVDRIISEEVLVVRTAPAVGEPLDFIISEGGVPVVNKRKSSLL